MPAVSLHLPCVLVSLKDASWEAFLDKHEFYGLYKDGAPVDYVLLTSEELLVDNTTLESYKCLEQDMGRLRLELEVMGRYENKEEISAHAAKIRTYRSIIQRAVNYFVVNTSSPRSTTATQNTKKAVLKA